MKIWSTTVATVPDAFAVRMIQVTRVIQVRVGFTLVPHRQMILFVLRTPSESPTTHTHSHEYWHTPAGLCEDLPANSGGLWEDNWGRTCSHENFEGGPGTTFCNDPNNNWGEGHVYERCCVCGGGVIVGE